MSDEKLIHTEDKIKIWYDQWLTRYFIRVHGVDSGDLPSYGWYETLGAAKRAARYWRKLLR